MYKVASEMGYDEIMKLLSEHRERVVASRFECLLGSLVPLHCVTVGSSQENRIQPNCEPAALFSCLSTLSVLGSGMKTELGRNDHV